MATSAFAPKPNPKSDPSVPFSPNTPANDKKKTIDTSNPFGAPTLPQSKNIPAGSGKTSSRSQRTQPVDDPNTSYNIATGDYEQTPYSNVVYGNTKTGQFGTYRTGLNSSVVTPFGAPVLPQSKQPVKTNVVQPSSFNFSSVGGRSQTVEPSGKVKPIDFVPFVNFTPNIRTSTQSDVNRAKESGQISILPQKQKITTVTGVRQEQDRIITEMQSRNFLTNEESAQLQKYSPFGFAVVEKNKSAVDAEKLYREERGFKLFSYTRPILQLGASSATRNAAKIQPALGEGQLNLFEQLSIGPARKAFREEREIGKVDRQRSFLLGGAKIIDEKIFKINPLVSSANVDVGFGAITTGVAVPQTALIAIPVGAGFLSTEVAKQRDFNRLTPEAKKRVLAQRDINTIFATAVDESKKGQKSLFSIPQGTPLIGGLAFEPSEFNIVGAASILSDGYLTTKRVDTQLAQREKKLRESAFLQTADPYVSEFLVGQKRSGVIGGAAGEIFTSAGSNVAGGALNILRSGAARKAVQAGERVALGEVLAVGSAKRVSYKAGLNSIFSQGIAGAGEAEINLFSSAQAEGRQVSKTDAALAAVFGGVSSATVGVGLNYFGTLEKIAPKASTRVGSKAGKGALYTIASFGSPEEPLGDILSSVTTPKNARRSILSFSGQDNNIKAVKGYSRGSLFGFTTTTSTAPSAFTNAFTVQDTGTTTRSNPLTFGDSFTFASTTTNAQSTTETPTKAATETVTDTLTGTFTNTNTNTFQNFALPFFGGFETPKSSGKSGAKERKTYYDELALSLNFGGLNLGGSKLQTTFKEEKPKKQKRYKYGLF